MQRRDLLKAAVMAAGATAPLRGFGAANELRDAARLTWLFGLPLIESAAARATVLKTGTAPNTMFRLRAPTTPKTQRITTPNNDTLNSRAWINLNEGPVTLTLPATGDRYVSVAMMDMYSNNFAVLGTRTTGPNGGRFTLIGPNAASNDPLAIRSPTPWMWVLIRLLADASDEIESVHALQDRFVLHGPAAAPPRREFATRAAPWPEYFASLQALMVENPPPATDVGLLHRIAPLGLSRADDFDAKRFTTAQAAQIEAGVADARSILRSTRRQGPVVDGWIYPKSNLGDFGQDYFYRAQIALNGFAALPVVEAMYMRAVADDGAMLFDGARSWTMRLPGKSPPPVNAFWSLTMYEATPDGQFFLFDNPIQRYSIGDRTQGLRKDTDGSVDIWIARNDPGGSRTANWLPAPPSRPFSLVFRTYLPGASLLDGEYRLPALQAA